MFIAVIHIVGAVLATVAFGVVVLLLASWEINRSGKQELQGFAFKLGVAEEDLMVEGFTPRLLEMTADYYSYDRLNNRLSDLCGLIRTAWGYLSTVVQIAFLVMVIWLTVTESAANGVYAWWLVVISFMFWITGVLFALLCRLLTGRSPGQAKRARKAISEYLAAQRNKVSSTEFDT
ncbi:hypothetical protein PHLH6_31060 [Pseudomonas sp. Seg1]|uniref:hypothetical protein n=1 Tax=Pseudomonas sp. Seg1 TaxID=2678259 RepID=UPI001BB35E59|nr:hypothetical protein [Pseudomonas sp. Seg1]BBP71102.1 hypothetical protein PHLH6_31060 [Pseudomonas sp. Seg1]